MLRSTRKINFFSVHLTEKCRMEIILPEIELEMTLGELYGAIGKEIFIVPTMLSSRFDLTPYVPRCTKYIYQHEAMNQPAHAGLEAVGGLSYVIKFLSMIPQQFAFAAGHLSVVMFDIWTSSPESEQIVKTNRIFAQETISVLQPQQRPDLRFYQGPADVNLNQASQILAPFWPVDGLDRLPHILEPEVHHGLHSKEGLARSGLPTPRFEVIEVSLPAEGVSAAWLQAETARITVQVQERPVPFAFKLQQTMLGFGTYLIHTEPEKHNFCSHVLPNVLANYLPYLNASNAQLHPANLVVTDLVENIAADLGVTFFVDQAGHCTFICGTTQHLEGGVFFSGSHINYRNQPQAEERLSDIMGKIGKFLYQKGYYGAVNADVLEDSSGKQYIVDLNVRMPGSYVLGALKTHFWARRGLTCASLLFRSLLRTSREKLIQSLRDDFTQGKIVIVAWYGDELSERSFAHLVVGAEDEGRLAESVQRVDELCER